MSETDAENGPPQKHSAGDSARILIPNLGAEEGDNTAAVAEHASARQAAQQWSLLFGKQDIIHWPLWNDGRAATGSAQTSKDAAALCEDLWPAALGDAPDEAAFSWLETNSVHAWLNTESVAREAHANFQRPLAGAPPESVRHFGDKAVAARISAELGLAPRPWETLVECLDAADCDDPDSLIPRLDAAIAAWPEWTRGRFTLKPRWGTSGRGRVAGVSTLDTKAIRGALPRLAARGGAILEPWCERETDLSVSLLIPHAESEAGVPTILGSHEMLTSKSGLYRGHCGEIDNRGRVFSGHREDENLRGDAAQLAGRTQSEGFFGPCGVDAFTYVEGDRTRLRSVVEFNPRITMGIVAIGLIRRALPLARQALDLSPGQRRAFLWTTFSPAEEPARRTFIERLDKSALALDLSTPRSAAPTPHSGSAPAAGADLIAETAQLRSMLFFAPDLESLRGAYCEAMDC